MAKALTPKERVRTTFARQAADRVPINYFANPGIDSRLKAHFGLAGDDDEGLRQALGVDFRTVHAPYRGPRLHAEMPERQVDPCWGVRTRYVEHESGGYWDYCDFPLRGAKLDTIESWPMPSPDDYDYAQVADQCRRLEPYGIVVGGAGLPDVINATGMIRNMEEVMVDLITGDPAFLRYVERKSLILLEVTRRTLEAAGGQADVLWLGEDLGTQRGPLISPRLYRKQIRPWHARFAALGAEFGIPVAIHSCGSSSWAFDDFVEIGIHVVDTLQPEATDMAPAYLKERYGERLAFHGCISTAGPLAYGTVDEVVQNVRETLAVMMPGGGYALSPTHQIQDNSPTENVLAMYEAAHAYGQY
jgi:uroporphyrinogen decarboxylase